MLTYSGSRRTIHIILRRRSCCALRAPPILEKNVNGRIHAGMELGPVSLTVSDLERSLAFYSETLGLHVQRQSAGVADLGAGGSPIVVLHEVRGARRRRSTAGLYHFAMLLPSELELGKWLRNMSCRKATVQGLADHLVSEAVYLADPDGNGIEVYCDRPRAQWPHDEAGRLVMATDPLDVASIMERAVGEWTGAPQETRLGHMHLHVGNLAEAVAFYDQTLGLDLMARIDGSAAFLSAGGYHHHIGINTWAGVGARPAPEGAVGLRWFGVRLPDGGALRDTLNRVRSAGVDVEEQREGVLVRDPSRNGIMLYA